MTHVDVNMKRGQNCGRGKAGGVLVHNADACRLPGKGAQAPTKQCAHSGQGVKGGLCSGWQRVQGSCCCAALFMVCLKAAGLKLPLRLGY